MYFTHHCTYALSILAPPPEAAKQGYNCFSLPPRSDLSSRVAKILPLGGIHHPATVDEKGLGLRV